MRIDPIAMRRRLCNRRALLGPFAALVLSSCTSTQDNGWVEVKPEPPGSESTIRVTGTVHHLDLEGGLFVIRDADGTQYQPINLPDDFRVDGMAVEAVARRRDDMMSIGMVGPLIELLRIRSGAGGDAVVPTPVASSFDPTGIWTVVGHEIPGISAMSDAEAGQWLGLTVRLSASEAISGATHCAEPKYAARSLTKVDLAAEFKLPPEALTRLSSLELLQVADVSCGGVPWAALGGRVIEVDANHALAPWDGVFFELERDRDFRALGQEPGWQIEIFKGKEIRFTYAYGESAVATPAPKRETDVGSGAVVYHAVTEANDLFVRIETVPCADVMSGEAYEATVTVTLNGQIFHGCGRAIP